MSRKSNKKIPKSVFGRTAKLIGLGANLVAKEIGGAIKDKINSNPDLSKLQTRLKQAQDMVESLGQLKGAAMKAGQLLSLEFSDMLPPEVTQILRNLHDNTTFMPYETVRKILVKEFGKLKFEQLKNFSRDPIAAASIGQVHRAIFNGKPVVVKVQYPGVAESIDADLALLKKMISTVMNLRGRSISFDAVFDELAEGLKCEVDYLQESKWIESYGKAFGSYSQYRIPEIIPEFVSARVIAMSFERGERLNKWLKQDMLPSDRTWFSELILELLLTEFFRTGLVQTDPNYGNFFIRPEEKLLVLLDFGAVKQYPFDFRENFKAILASAISGDRDEMLRTAKPFNLIDERESKEAHDKFFELMDTIAYIFRPENQPFSFSDADYLEKIRKQSLGFATVVRHTSPASKMIFLNRKLGGMYHLLKDANCKVDLNKFWMKVP